MNLSKTDLDDALISMINSTYTFVKRNSSIIFSLAMTVIFFYPALICSSRNAGFLYGGDVIGWYLPALAKTHELIHAFNFTAIDYSAFNGSSDFFLSPNFFAYHPLVVLYCLFVSPTSIHMKDLGHFLVFLMAFHTFLACYFSIKVFTRFFDFEFATAAIIATVFAFSDHMVNALGQPPFLFCATIIPWAMYTSLAYAETPSLRRLVFAILPVIFGFMGGYMPLGVACLWLSIIMVATKLLYLDSDTLTLKTRIHALIYAAVPYVCAALLVGPFLISVYRFHHETSSAGVVSLFYSAHQLAQLPQSILKFVSLYFSVPGKIIEFSIAWGFVAIITAAIFLFSPKTIGRLNNKECKLFKIAVVIYSTAILSTFGDHSVVSDLVYYFVPQVGGMHIYQRFLLPVQLIFAIMISLMLKAIIKERPIYAIRIALALFGALTLWVAYIVSYKPELEHMLGLNNYIVIELLLGFLFASALIVPGKKFVYAVAVFLLFNPVLNRMYDYSIHGHTFINQEKRQVLALNESERARLVQYLEDHFGDKAVVKYVDITPMWGEGGVELFPKVFPYFILNEMRLSSYGGFTFYLSARAEYLSKMPVREEVAVKPDWELVAKSGADFVVARESDFKNTALTPLIDGVNSEDIYKLSNHVVIVPLRLKREGSDLTSNGHFDNGVLKILPAIDKPNLINVAVAKIASQSSTGGGNASLAVDGNTDGDFSHGSVTHTGGEASPWLDIDLGKIYSIDSLRIWNRTDCCGERLHDFWVFISNTPFLSTDTVSMLRDRKGVWGRINTTPNPKITINTSGINGRYIRVQLDSKNPDDKNYLSLAEVEAFRSIGTNDSNSSIDYSKVPGLKINEFNTNYADYMVIDFEASVPTNVQYLFFNNPRLKFYLNGARVKSIIKDELTCFEVPAGHNRIEIRYRHLILDVFWIFYTVYALIFLYVLMPVRLHKAFIKKLTGFRLYKHK